MLDVTPEVLTAASGQVAALTARLIAANATHAAAMAGALPPGSDLPSIKVSATLIQKGLTHEAAAAVGNVEMAGSALGVGESGVSYQVGDAEAVAVYSAAGGLAV